METSEHPKTDLRSECSHEILQKRKSDHIELAFQSKVGPDLRDNRFDYEPLLSAHPNFKEIDLNVRFLGKELEVPLLVFQYDRWIKGILGDQ